jgi:hypothetical protein
VVGGIQRCCVAVPEDRNDLVTFSGSYKLEDEFITRTSRQGQIRNNRPKDCTDEAPQFVQIPQGSRSVSVLFIKLNFIFV